MNKGDFVSHDRIQIGYILWTDGIMAKVENTLDNRIHHVMVSTLRLIWDGEFLGL